MPTYEYECGACGHCFELFQGINEPARRKCPRCLKLSVRRLIGTGAGVLFKGSGFYCTDYRSDSGGKGGAEKSGPKQEKAGEVPAGVSDTKNNQDSQGRKK
jgi:putative FmdB family regulatory protein